MCINNAVVSPHLMPAVRSQRVKSKGKQSSFKVAFTTQSRPKMFYKPLGPWYLQYHPIYRQSNTRSRQNKISTLLNAMLFSRPNQIQKKFVICDFRTTIFAEKFVMSKLLKICRITSLAGLVNADHFTTFF
jgi:hypothetical protein